MTDLPSLPPGVTADRSSRISLYRQVYEGMRSAILEGRIEGGARLPSTRAVASELGVSRNVAIAVFEQLAAEGYVHSRVGDGTRVADIPPELIGGAPAMRSRSSNMGATARQPRQAFPSALSERSRSLAGVTRGVPGPERLGYADASGDPRLCAAIAAHLQASRGVDCAPERVIVVTGAQAALDLCVRLLLDPGDAAWTEDPGYSGAKAALIGAGAKIEAIPVDVEGLDVAAGEARCPRARLAYITPSCQFPLGATLTLERRLLLLDWAERAGAFVLEDDYDSEYRYRGRPIAALQGLDENDRVVYVGTFSKTMLPALRVGYVIAPR